MRIRQDFVTNSSSTNFIISIKGNFTFDNFLKGLRMSKKCELVEMVKNFFDVIDSKKETLKNYSQTYFKDQKEAILQLCKNNEEKIDTINELLADKRKVYVGYFEDHADSAEEEFLCTSSYFIANEDLYFDFENDGSFW
jgi:hypothetical protein